jgi:hypothetical protein
MAIRTFTKSGKAVTITRRSGVPTTPLGRLDPTTGKIWQKPRIVANVLAGSRVRVTAPRASLATMTNSMTSSIGMGGKGQRGRNRDVGSTKARGEA